MIRAAATLPISLEPLVSDTFTSTANALCRPLWIKLYPRHHTFSVHGNPHHQPTAVEALSYRYGALISQGAISPDQLPSGVNPSKSPDWSFDINVLFPNFLVAVSAGWYFTYHFWPLAVDRTLFEVRNYYLPPENAGNGSARNTVSVSFGMRCWKT